MPTLLREKGFQFFFYANEHEPRHIHVMKAGCFAKISLVSLNVIESCLRPSDLRMALEIVKEHRYEFENKWITFFSR